jgi:hypothetical protein
MKKKLQNQTPDCQLGHLDQIHRPLNALEGMWQLRNRAKRIIKRRLAFVKNVTQKALRNQLLSPSNTVELQPAPLKAGDSVRIRSEAEIKATLGKWNDLEGCAFMEEMWSYSGTTQLVLKRVERFLDERDYRTKKVRGIVILDRVNCQGTVDFGPCDRNCFFFWREEWLEKTT